MRVGGVRARGGPPWRLSMGRSHSRNVREKPCRDVTPTTSHLSPKLILLAKAETRTMQGPHARVNSVCQPAGSHQHDFAIRTKNGEEPNGIKLSSNALLYQCFACLS